MKNNLKEKKKKVLFSTFLLLTIALLVITNIFTNKIVDIEFNVKFISIYDSQFVWSEQDNKLEIFNSNRNDNSEDKKIYPGVSGIYYFSINNDTPQKTFYNITLNEDNDLKIKMNYKLIKKSMIDDMDEIEYEKISNIKVEDIIDESSIEEYALYWQWKEDDSFINDGGEYTLYINIKYEYEDDAIIN